MKRRARRHACALCARRKLTHIELRHVGLVCLLYEGKLEEMPQRRQAVRWCALIGEHCRRPSEAAQPLLGWACASDSGVVLRRIVISCDDCFKTRALGWMSLLCCHRLLKYDQFTSMGSAVAAAGPATIRTACEAGSLFVDTASRWLRGNRPVGGGAMELRVVGGKPSQEPRGCHRRVFGMPARLSRYRDAARWR